MKKKSNKQTRKQDAEKSVTSSYLTFVLSWDHMSQPSSNRILQQEDTDKTEIDVNNMCPAKEKSLKIKVW